MSDEIIIANLKQIGKDIETIFGNLEINQNGIKRLNNRLSELEKELKIQFKLFKKTTHINTCSQLMTEVKEEIAELKEEITYIKQWQEGDCDVKEVLRDIIEDEDALILSDVNKRRKEVNSEYILVKREDLQWSLEMLRGWHVLYPIGIDEGEEEKLKRIKEAYGIE